MTEFLPILVNSTGGTAPVSLSATGLPDGLSFFDFGNGGGQIQGVVADGAADESPYTVTVTATDHYGIKGTTTFTFSISPGA